MGSCRGAVLAAVFGVFGPAVFGLAATPEKVEQTAAGDPATAGRAVLEGLQRDVAWLAAPERQGRGPGTAGIDEAAEWIAARFAELGLAAPGRRESVWQPFEMTLGATLGPAGDNRAELLGPPAADGSRRLVRLVLGEDFTPLAIGGSGPFDLPLAFVGYGITAPAEHYDDYAPLADSEGGKGRGVIVLRQEPQKDDPHGAFEGNQTSQHAALVRKAANASEHEAGGLIFLNDTDAGGDDLMAFDRAGAGSDSRTMPILHIKRSVIDRIISESLGRPLREIQRAIDDSLKPQSAELAGWRIRGRTAIERVQTEGRNVLAILPGTGRPAAGDQPAIPADETVILGAHYDHLGFGGTNSAAPGVEAVHPGADDNASGTALLVEVARRLAAGPPLPRTVLFAAFSGEERGLLGSAHYTANPPVPLAETVAMVNLDMVGRLDGGKVVVHGTGTGTGLEPLVDRLVAAHGLDAAKEPGGFGPSDHASFYAKGIPVLHVFTGSHTDYHRPTDTAEKINYEGMARLADLVTDLVRELASTPERPAHIEVASPQFARGGDRPYFGSIPDFGKPGDGYAISGVSKESPAARGGLQGGDRIVRLGESAITNLEDFDSALRKHKGGDTVPVVVIRDGQEVRLEVTLDPPR